MKAEQWERVQRLFEEAAALPPHERDAFLAEACGDDPEVRDEVESLLSHNQQASANFMRLPNVPEPVAGSVVTKRCDPLIGSAVGNYRIKGLIASGGMGSVYEAEQRNPKRVVALKIQKAGVASASGLRHFERESKILGHLRHPNIGQVFEAGTFEDTTGSQRPYFAMEYVPDSYNIREYCCRQDLSLRERLRLFVQVCEAVHHGHQKGIIHRDLKPANILVDSSGQVKVIDFGIARATDSDLAITTMQTETGHLVGTLQYMSPEQCDADPHAIDTRSDVYSLGVVLFETLTGSLPYNTLDSSVYQAVKIIKEEIPSRPSSVNPRVRRDLEIIIQKALEKDPEKRYQSASELAKDIIRYLDGDPIEAKPPTLITHAIRWAARHPMTTTLIGCSLIACITLVATLVAIWIVNSQPHSVRIVGEGREARVLSRVGRILHSWSTEKPGNIPFAKMVQRPAALGGGKLVIIGFQHLRDEKSRKFRNSLCAYEADQIDPESPLWERHVKTEELPESLRDDDGLVGEEFAPRHLLVADVFKERPGEELVVEYSHTPYSPCVIRIYDLNGELLYQVWQNGGVGGGHWMAEAGILVFAARNKNDSWEKRGYESIRYDPIVIFALRPTLGDITTEFVRSRPETGASSQLWYRWLLPPQLCNLPLVIRLQSPLGRYNPGRSVLLGIDIGGEARGGLSWVINESGAFIDGSRVLADNYKRNIAELPNPDDFQLVAIPPRRP